MKNQLRAIRMAEFKMSSKDFAKKLNVPYTTYLGWENGRSQPPLETAINIARKLNRKVEDIWQ